MTFLLHSALGVHLSFANLAFLVLDRDFRVQFVLFDGALLLHCRVAAGINGLVGFFEELLAGFRFQGARRFGSGFDG